MEYHVYWLLKSSCFKLSGDGKYSLFWAKKMMERWYLLITGKLLFWTFRRWEIQSFLSQKMMERWYLLISGKLLFWTFRRREIQSFLSQKVDEKMIFTDYWKVHVLRFEKLLFWTFHSYEIRSFFEPKHLWKDNIYLVFLSFLRYSRTWEIWFFVQWQLFSLLKFSILSRHETLYILTKESCYVLQ